MVAAAKTIADNVTAVISHTVPLEDEAALVAATVNDTSIDDIASTAGHLRLWATTIWYYRCPS